MRKNGIGLVLLLIVALIVAYLVVGNMKSINQTSVSTGLESSQGENPIDAARDVVDQYNNRMNQSLPGE